MAGTRLALRAFVSQFATPFVKVFVVLIPLTVGAGRIRSHDFPTTPAELNRCLAAVRAVCARRIRSPHQHDDQPVDDGNAQPLQPQRIRFRLHLR